MVRENIRFNAIAYIDSMYLDGKPALHIVDEATRFSVARFPSNISADAVWEALILFWSSVCTAIPENIMVDEGAQLSDTFADLAKLHDINVEKSGIQSHNSLGISGRYHRPLRDIYKKLKIDFPSMQCQVLLTMA